MPTLLSAQTSQLRLGQIAAPTGHAAFNLNLSSDGSADVAALQWTLQYTPNTVADASVVEENGAFSGNKQLSCTTTNSALTCILVGLNSSPIPNGPVALITLTLVSGAQTDVSLASGVAASSYGDSVATDIPFNSIRLGRTAEQHAAPSQPQRTVATASPGPGMDSAPPSVVLPAPPSFAPVSPRWMWFERGATPLPASPVLAAPLFAESPVLGHSEAGAESPANGQTATDQQVTERQLEADQTQQDATENNACDADSTGDATKCTTKECLARRQRPCQKADEISHKKEPSKAPLQSATPARSLPQEK